MDTELIKEEKMLIVNDGDIWIGCGASFSEILDVLVEHANSYLDFEYNRMDIIKEFMGAIND